MRGILPVGVLTPSVLPESILESVLARLGFRARPDPSIDSLRLLYDRWCRTVPFDNVRKLIHVRSAQSGPLPGSTPADFFSAWLQHGTGGTCWPGAGALHALLVALGFEAVRGIATMLVAPELPPNHASTMVSFGDAKYLVDSSILHGEPLLLDREEGTAIAHPAWGVSCHPRVERWHVGWRPLHKVDGFECRLERFADGEAGYGELYQQTRGWSPFNYEVTVRLNCGSEVTGLAFGRAVTLRGDGSVDSVPVDHETRCRILIDTLGMSEEIVCQLPEDIATPPPPWSRTAS